MVFDGIHGCYPTEKKFPQPYQIDITLQVAVAPAVADDDLQKAVIMCSTRFFSSLRKSAQALFFLTHWRQLTKLIFRRTGSYSLSGSCPGSASSFVPHSDMPPPHKAKKQCAGTVFLTLCAPRGTRTPNDGSEDRCDIHFTMGAWWS